MRVRDRDNVPAEVARRNTMFNLRQMNEFEVLDSFFFNIVYLLMCPDIEIKQVYLILSNCFSKQYQF